jgi:transposase InsO family protein
MAIAQCCPEAGLIHHSDQGQQYAGAAYRAALNEHAIIQSISRKGNCLDNAVAESIFSNLKRWLRAYRRWEQQHAVFLKERSYGEPKAGKKRSWWYTHRNIRAARSLLRNALPHLFTFVRYPHVPRTTNHVGVG